MTIIKQKAKDIGEIEKIEKYSQKNVRIVYNSFRVRICICASYICVLLCVIVYMIFSMFVYEDTCAARQIWGCLPNIWGTMCSQSDDRLTE